MAGKEECSLRTVNDVVESGESKTVFWKSVIYVPSAPPGEYNYNILLHDTPLRPTFC